MAAAAAPGGLPPNVTPATQTQEEVEFIISSFGSFLNDFSFGEVAPSSTIRPSNKDEKYYEVLCRDMQSKDRSTLEVDFMHLRKHDADLADRVQLDYYRIEPMLRTATTTFAKRIFDATPRATDDQTSLNEYNLSFYNLPEQIKLRDLKTDRIGCLSRITGTVTRTSEVRPELVLAHFQCTDCYTEQEPTEQQFKYTEPIICKNPTCANRRNWYLNIDKSKFIDFQRVRIQENSHEIPPGSMPRSLDVIVRHEMVDRAKPGDKVVFTGALVVVPDISQLSSPGERPEAVRETGARNSFAQEGVTGLRSLGVRELSYKMSFLACAVHMSDMQNGAAKMRDDSEEANVSDMDDETVKKILRMSKTPNLYQRLVTSVCPTVFGHDEVKKGLLLMLLGGVHKKTKTQTNLRGDINVCVVGDPSCAKSQFLKYVSGFMPRAVYTSGKASTAAGLTASVIKDEETGEFGIEAGALMLADNGICCIDEFDKMDIKDQVAIHEAMEQQTISIAKAGIQATLNARTSILAAANPRDGRYDRSKSLKANVDISPPIMSRFDLFFVILDECNEVTDFNIARHIIGVHMDQDKPPDVEFSKEELQRYIRYARSIKPRMNKEAKERLVEHYRELRENDGQGAARAAYRITVRQLESMIRLSEALARLHCDAEVKTKYVDEAKRLLKQSIIRVDSEDVSLDDFDVPEEQEDEDEAVPPGGGGAGDDDDDDNQGGGGGGGGGSNPSKRGDAAAEPEATPGKKQSKRKRGKGEKEQEEPKPDASPSPQSAKKAAGSAKKAAGSATKAAAPEAAQAAGPAAAAGAGEGEPAPKKAKLEISREEYDHHATIIMRQLLAREEEARGEGELEEWTQGELVNWYLEQREDLDTEEALVMAKRVVTSIIERLIVSEHWIIVLNASEVQDMAGSPAERRNARKLAARPSYTPASA